MGIICRDGATAFLGYIIIRRYRGLPLETRPIKPVPKESECRTRSNEINSRREEEKKKSRNNRLDRKRPLGYSRSICNQLTCMLGAVPVYENATHTHPGWPPKRGAHKPIPSPPSVCHPVSSLKPIHLISRVSSRLSSWIGRMRRQNRAMPSCLKCPLWRSDPGGSEVADQMVRTRWRPQLADAPAPRPWTHQLEADSERFRLLLVWRFAWAGALKRVRGHGTAQSRDGDLDHASHNCGSNLAHPLRRFWSSILQRARSVKSVTVARMIRDCIAKKTLFVINICHQCLDVDLRFVHPIKLLPRTWTVDLGDSQALTSARTTSYIIFN